MKLPKTLKFTALWATTLVVAASIAKADMIVAPPAFETVDAGGISDGPLGLTGSGGRRYQQIYDASLFSGLSGPQIISEIQFRAANTENSFRPNSLSATNVIVTLSTTSVTSTPGATAANAFSASFDDNVGSDAQVVYSGALTLDRGGSNPTSQPQPFEYGFTLQLPFTYDPSMGNLLLDFVVPTSATVSQGTGFGKFEDFDAVTLANDGIASVRGTSGNAIGAAGETGLITRFTTTAAVPEPSTVVLFAVAAIGLVVVRSTGAMAGRANRRV